MNFDYIILHEDLNLDNFYPLTLSTPLSDIVIGGFKLIEHILFALSKLDLLNVKILIKTRNYLAKTWSKIHTSILKELGLKYEVEYIDENFNVDGKTLNISLRILPEIENILKLIRIAYESKSAIVNPRGENLVWISGTNRKQVVNQVLEFEGVWSIIKYNIHLMQVNLPHIVKLLDLTEISKRVFTLDSTIDEFVKFNVDNGLIVIIKSHINSFTYLEAPIVIGPSSKIMPNTILRGGTSIYLGNVIGGEVKNTIFCEFSNKEHYGYFGDSYVGRWVNIGAGTTTSNLKNTYGNIKFRGKETGLRKLGSIICDWVKTSINTSIMCGKYIGQNSHVYGVVYSDVPPYTIYMKSINGKIYELSLDKAIEIHRRVISSKKKSLIDEEIELMKIIYELTRSDRASVAKEPLKLT